MLKYSGLTAGLVKRLGTGQPPFAGAGGVDLRLGLSLGFRVGSRIRTRIRVRFGIGSGSRIRIGRCRGRGRGNIATSLVPLHVPHTSDGLDLRCSGSPVVPVLEFSMFKHILAPSVAWICVSHPPLEKSREKHFVQPSWDSEKG